LGSVGSLAHPKAATHPRVLARTDHYTPGNGPDHGDGFHSSPSIRRRGRNGDLHRCLLRRLLSLHGEESYALRSGQSHLAGGHWGELLTLSIEYRPSVSPDRLPCAELAGLSRHCCRLATDRVYVACLRTWVPARLCGRTDGGAAAYRYYPSGNSSPRRSPHDLAGNRRCHCPGGYLCCQSISPAKQSSG